MEDEKKPEKTMYEEISGMYSEMKTFQSEMSNMREEMKTYSETMRSYMEMMKPKNEETPEEEKPSMYSELEEKVKALEQQKEEVVRKYSEFENKTFVENLVTSGKLLPALQEDSLQILNTASDEKLITYSENGQNVQISVKEKFKNFLNSLGKLNIYEEVAPSGREKSPEGQSEEDIEVTELDRKNYPDYDDQEIKKHKKIIAYAEKNKLSYAEAFNVIFG